MTKTTSKLRFGANFNEANGRVEFKLFSKSGGAAILCIFDRPLGSDSILEIRMEKAGDVFLASFDPDEIFYKGFLQNGGVFYYGYRVFGPNYQYTENWTPGLKEGFKSRLDNKNNRFNPNKLAYDPYSRELSHLHGAVDKSLEQIKTCNELENFRSGKKYFEDNAKIAPKTVFRLNSEIEILKPATGRALRDEIIGEVHLKSLTKLWNGTDSAATYKAAGEFAEHIKALGVTMVEFLPVYEFDEAEGIGNYWGYMPLCFFAPHKKYAYNQADGAAIVEFREMIRALHQADIKVCLDVVYNHTGEAKIYNNDREDVNLFSYALIDNQEYYKADSLGFYAANSGCHNDSNTAKTGFKNLIVDSLEYWVKQGVDAFRFDLATSLMDVESGVDVCYDRDRSIVGSLKKELLERGIYAKTPDEADFNGSNNVQNRPECEFEVNLIAEPWTCGGHDAYQLGNFPEFFAEWCDISRNLIRAYSIRPHSVDFLGVRYLLEGTPQKFKNPFRPVNYVACHDGFTLWDLNSYDKKSENTCGGSDWEISSSYNGDKVLKERGIRSQMALLALSSGCFMVQIDDIVLHSKGGNNNSYNIDGPINYINYDIPPEKLEISRFIKDIILFRRDFSAFKEPEYAKNADFFDEEANIIKAENSDFWTNTNKNYMAFMSKNKIESLFAAFNKGEKEIEAELPPIDKNYYLVFDTKNNDFYRNEGLFGKLYGEKTFKIAPHTIIVMAVR